MSSLVIQTTYGPVRGAKRTTHLGEEVFSFLGIPYAKPPLGPLRFKDPQPPAPWLLPRDATVNGRKAIHKITIDADCNELAANCDEDCLFINVYTKELKPSKPLPVMVWIHGGAFKIGSADEELYGPDYLLQKNVVFVSMNYRLGALGFLSITDPSVNVPGNAGLKDQALALKWVRQNIARFGGDTSNVTLFGESAGAASVHLHMISNMSRGLFDKAIVQSGSALSPWSDNTKTNWASRLAKKLGWTGEGGPRGVYDFLKEADARQIILAQDLHTPQEKFAGAISFGPIQEPYRSEQTFINVPYNDLAMNPWSVDIPLLIGGCSEEGFLFGRAIKAFAAVLQSPLGVHALVGEQVFRAKPDSAQDVITFYYGKEVPEVENILPIVYMWGDRYFWHGIHAAVEARIKKSGSGKTYLYRFAAKSKVLIHVQIMITGEPVDGTCHGDDVLYLFRPAMVTDMDPGSVEAQTIERAVSIWTHFAKTGDPNSEIIQPHEWKPIESTDDVVLKGLNIDEDLSIIEFPEEKRIAFWNTVLKI